MSDPPARAGLVCYRFGDFELLPAQRRLLRAGAEIHLVPRYFDLLLLLLERRHEAVTRQEIMDSVWSDAVVSDGALSQAVRTLRRAFSDDPREPRFIQTVSRHGYRFAFADVAEERASEPAHPRPVRVVGRGALAAGVGGLMAGVAAGTLGGLLLSLLPSARAPSTLSLGLAALGGLIGGLGGAGVGAGLAACDTLPARWWPAAPFLGALGGGAVGWAAHVVGRAAFEGLFGGELSGVGGGLEGLGLGAAAGVGRVLSRGRRLASAVPLLASCCAAGGIVVALAGGRLAGASLQLMARSYQGSQVQLEPLARLLGESSFGDLTAGALSAVEAGLFGAGLALGLGLAGGRPR